MPRTILTAGLALTALAGALVAAPAALAQPAATAAPTATPTPAPSRDAALREAYQKEYAFLVAQKRTLSERVETFERDSQRKENQLDALTRRLEAELLALESEVDRVNSTLNEAELALASRTDDRSILEATVEQARVTLSEMGEDVSTPVEAGGAEQVAAVWQAALSALFSSAEVRREPGAFFLEDGRQTEGELVHFGRVATYGISDEAAGGLAPAGGGALKIWPAATGQTATALAQGQQPQTLSIFLIENRNREVEDEGGRTPLETIAAGGTIAWIIVALGVLALVLSILRAAFLKRASTNTQVLSRNVAEKLRAGDREGALAYCESHSGAISRVVAATLRNLDRDPDHVEDIVSEGILSESNHLDRFGALILIIAAVSPLLGLLGTVTGMISTFDVITEFGTGDPKLLSGGISVALITTELGLIVAIPALMLGNVLSGWAERIKDDMEKAALRVINVYREATAR